ncbi:hypothetical protein ABK040_013424 [Willaertia magna]
MRIYAEALTSVLRKGKLPNTARTPKKLMGAYHQKKGVFMFDKSKVPIFANPDMSDFKLKPYVSHTTPKNPEKANAKKTTA